MYYTLDLQSLLISNSREVSSWQLGQVHIFFGQLIYCIPRLFNRTLHKVRYLLW